MSRSRTATRPARYADAVAVLLTADAVVNDQMMDQPSTPVTVAIVAICGEAHLERCLAALEPQRKQLGFDIVIAAAPRLGSLARLRERFPLARIIVREGVTTPIELAASAVSEARGELVLLTEDHCVPDRDWVERLARSITEGRGAVGGTVDPLDEDEMTAFDWAFYFVDFFRYLTPVGRGVTDALSDCNVGYRRTDLEGLDEPWRTSFHETRIHDALSRRVGPLWMEPDARVTAGRKVHRADALRERYAFGRIYACRRIDPPHGYLRPAFVLAFPLLPLVQMTRLARAAWRHPATARRFRRSLPDLAALVLAWAVGEGLGYITARMPATADAAAERGPLGESQS